MSLYRNLAMMGLLAAFAAAQTPAPPAKPAPAAKPARDPGLYGTFNTSMGPIVVRLYEKEAPITVKNFIDLEKGRKAWTDPKTGQKVRRPLYNGTTFHRVIPEFMIQGGDPAGNGTGDPGYAFKNETSPDLTFDRPGRMAYANAGPNTNGSQFFITEVPYPSLDGHYTIFGQCDDASVELVKKIARMPRNGNDLPNNPVKINKIAILGSGANSVHHATTTHKPMPAPKPAPQPTKQQ
jgi:peptidyl-prolyl cis-trans isomerase A (cyclophilin A)